MTLLRRVVSIWKEYDRTAQVCCDFHTATPSWPWGDDVPNEIVNEAFNEAAIDLAVGCHSHKNRTTTRSRTTCSNKGDLGYPNRN